MYRQKGFTLIELLVVIAIIAILVVIVIIAINPVERLNEAADQRAAANVRSTGSLIATCMTRELAAATPSTCTVAELTTYGTPSAGVATVMGTQAPCASQTGRAGTVWNYSWQTGQVTSGAAVAACP